MKIVQRLTIVTSAVMLAAGCASNKDRNETSSSGNYEGTTSYQTTASNSSSKNNQEYAPGESQTSGAPTAATSASEADRQLTAQVQQQLQADAAFAAIAPNLQITAQNGTITLKGNVPSDQQKEKLEAAIRDIAGVVSVNNRLQVSLSPTSERSSQSSKIYSEPASQSVAKNADEPAKDTAATTPQGQSSIENQASAQTDSKDQVSASTSATASSLPASDTAGVQNQGSKDQPALSATSDKPNDTSRVYSKSDSPSQQTSAASNPNIQASTEADRTLGNQIMQGVNADASLATLAPMIKIKVENGQVVLRGTVKSESEKQQLEAAVQKVSGVTKVDNQLKVTSGDQATPSDTSTDSTTKSDTK
ncbi:MAG: hyperosmotically inducible periplasmic protein [Verrucomicrobiota bacterium]